MISVVDSELGRITISYTTGPDGTRWTSVWPTSPDALRQDLGNLLNAAKAPASPPCDNHLSKREKMHR